MAISLKERAVEVADLLREVIHDATAPMDDELRQRARQVLALFAAIPGTLIAFTMLIWVLFLSGCAPLRGGNSTDPKPTVSVPQRNTCPLGSVPEGWPCRVKY